MTKFWAVWLLIATASAIVAVEKFRFAVSPLKGYGDLYVRIKNTSQLPVVPSRTETVEEKKSICAAIINSSYFPFYSHYGNLLNLHDKPVRLDLAQNHPDFYEAHYGIPAASVVANSSFDDESVNPYRLRNVTVNKQSFEELLFSCLSRNRGSVMVLGVMQYFITAEYNVHEGTVFDGAGAGGKNIGRFVFSSVQGQTSLAPIVLAEEVVTRPALRSTDVADHVGHSISAENAFWSEHYEADIISNTDKQFRDHSIDPLCRLSTFRKIRLCTAIFNSDGYREEFGLLPKLDIVQLPQECVRRKLYFKHRRPLGHKNSSSSENDTADYAKLEWMVPCHAVRIRDRERVIRYVLRSNILEPNKYYIGVETEANKTYIEGYRLNVGVTLFCRVRQIYDELYLSTLNLTVTR